MSASKASIASSLKSHKKLCAPTLTPLTPAELIGRTMRIYEEEDGAPRKLLKHQPAL
ncbi:hypothetical protein SESBI_08413 [Sesbania bispinosa]|nr:hypothetical protein SESBI_08413 [Sesbania bispinosa]